MTKPIGYFCSGAIPGDTGLIADMQESWGSTFEALNNAQRLWLIRSAANHLFNEDPNSDIDCERDDEVEEAIERLRELNKYELLALLEAVLAQVKTSRQ